MTTDQRIPVRLAGIPTRDIVDTLGKALMAAERRDLADRVWGALNVELALRAVSEDVHFIWTREEQEKEAAV